MNEELREIYRQAGRKGGNAKVPTKGFGSNRELAREAGRKGARKRAEQAKAKLRGTTKPSPDLAVEKE